MSSPPAPTSEVAAVDLAPVAQGAAERMARAHYDSLLRLGVRLSGSEVEARDLVQDTFERALRRHSSFKEGTSERAWLHTILYNAFIDGRRSRAGRAFVSDAALADEPAPSERAPEVWSTISREQLTRAIDALGDDFRDVYRMHAIDQRSYKEIAEALAILPQTVKTRLVRARQKLKVTLLAMTRSQTEAP